jgi:hypothetical protein
VLVVSKESGLPSSGFTAAQDVPKAQLDAFTFDWLAHGCPTPQQFAKAVQERPSRG